MTECSFVGELVWTSVGWIGEEETIFLQNEWKFRSRPCPCGSKFEIGNRWLAVCWCLDFSLTETSRLRKKREWKGKYVYRYVYRYVSRARKDTQAKRYDDASNLFSTPQTQQIIHSTRNEIIMKAHGTTCRFCNHTILLPRFVPCIWRIVPYWTCKRRDWIIHTIHQYILQHRSWLP